MPAILIPERRTRRRIPPFRGFALSGGTTAFRQGFFACGKTAHPPSPVLTKSAQGRLERPLKGGIRRRGRHTGTHFQNRGHGPLLR